MPKNVKNLKIGFDIRNSAIRFISRAVNNMPNIFQCLETDVLDKRISEIMTQCILMNQSILKANFSKNYPNFRRSRHFKRLHITCSQISLVENLVSECQHRSKLQTEQDLRIFSQRNLVKSNDQNKSKIGFVEFQFNRFETLQFSC